MYIKHFLKSTSFFKFLFFLVFFVLRFGKKPLTARLITASLFFTLYTFSSKFSGVLSKIFVLTEIFIKKKHALVRKIRMLFVGVERLAVEGKGLRREG